LRKGLLNQVQELHIPAHLAHLNTLQHSLRQPRMAGLPGECSDWLIATAQSDWLIPARRVCFPGGLTVGSKGVQESLF